MRALCTGLEMRLNKKPLSAFKSLRDEQILENIAFPLKDLKTPLTSQKLASVLALVHSAF
ncbi:hypothetical protein ECC10_06220 [Helicobacter pylori]|nr:hypothetical protein ECC10_06220 [Helicobacter pylori]